MLTISVWPRRLKEFLLTHPLYKSPPLAIGAKSPATAHYNVGPFNPRSEHLTLRQTLHLSYSNSLPYVQFGVGIPGKFSRSKVNSNSRPEGSLAYAGQTRAFT